MNSWNQNKKSFICRMLLIAGLCLLAICIFDILMGKKMGEDVDDIDAFSEDKDYTNPYALDTETTTGGYLYAIFEANKGCDADGEWFIDDSDRFTYYEVYNPLNDEYRSAYWEISLSEMKGTDKLAQAVNEYHAELYESQKIMIQEKQKEVTAMSIDDYLKYMNGSHYSANIRTKASFEWGYIFTVVDMEDTIYSTCMAVPANFNRVTGEKYEFADLFNTEDYKEKLVEIIRHKFGDTYALRWIVEFKHSFSFAITYHGLLLCENGTSKTLLIEWSELENILSQKMISDVLEYAAWNNE